MAGKDQLVVKVNEKLRKMELPTIRHEHIDALFDEIIEMVKGGDRVQLQHFGSFFRRLQAPRVARNPKTGEPINVVARVKFDLQSSVPHFELNEEEKVRVTKMKLVPPPTGAVAPVAVAKPVPVKKAAGTK